MKLLFGLAILGLLVFVIATREKDEEKKDLYDLHGEKKP